MIEDCAQSVGANYEGQKVGGFGILSVYSFYATKVLTTGEGGMVVSDSEELVSKVKDLREYDNKDDFAVRFNSKMTDIQAALGLNQLSRLEKFLEKRREIASLYFREFIECNFAHPLQKEARQHIYYRFILKIQHNASSPLEKCQQKKVMCRRPVHIPLHVCLELPGFPHTTGAWQRTVSIPLYPSLTQEEIQKIIAVVKEIF